MATVLGRRACIALVAALGIALSAAAGARADVLSASVSASPTGQTMGSGFVGVSFEYRALHIYTGRDPRAVNPVLLGLLQGLVPGQPPVIRIGGDSTDGSWWPIRGMIPQGGIYYRITKGWLRTTQALAADLRAKLILGINLAAGRPAIAAAEGQALLSGIGRKYIDALEIGNEPDLYNVFAWYKDRRGHSHRARTKKYNLAAYTKQFTQWSRVLPNLPLAGPVTSGPSWMGSLGRFISSERRLGVVTYHRYPLYACGTDTTAPSYPSIPHLFANSSSSGLAQGLAAYVRVAHQHKLPFRVAEMNTASCEGAKGVSDTFASALWSLDTMFNFAAVGVDGVNFHMLPGSNYELFTVSHSATGAWQAFVHPEYYGLEMFAQAFPPGARLLPVSGGGGTGSAVKLWATRAADGTTRVVAINEGTADHSVSMQVPGASTTGALEALQAPSVTATSEVTLGGQSFGAETSTGKLPGAPATTPVASVAGSYSFDVPPASAQLLTIPPAPSVAPPASGSGGAGGL